MTGAAIVARAPGRCALAATSPFTLSVDAVSHAPPDPDQVLASLARTGAALELPTLDLCFLAALYLRADRSG